jgi:uncharacterized protein YuzE
MTMHVTYDPEGDVLYVQLRAVESSNSVDIEDGVTADLDSDGHIIGLEVLDARKRMGGDPLDNVLLERLLPDPDEELIECELAEQHS